MITVLLTLGMMSVNDAQACPGKATTAQASTDTTTKVATADASACAKKAELVGGSCSYSTGMMAQRVLDEGSEFSFIGTLNPSEKKLASNVAAPWEIAGDIRVIANQIAEQADPSKRLSLHGKTLEVDGVTYLVVTRFENTAT